MYQLIILAIFFLLAILFKRKINYINGINTELYMRGKLKKLDPNHYRVLNNILIPSNYKNTVHTAQIDHLVISSFGIFCIETKGHKGWIYGSGNRRYWTETFASKRHWVKKYKVYNPLWQNYGHIKALESILGSSLKSPIISLIALPYAGRLVIDKLGRNQYVGSGGETIDTIKSYDKLIYGGIERKNIYELINNNIIHEHSKSKNHRKEIKSQLHKSG